MLEVLTKKKKIFFYLLTVGLIIFIPIVCYFGFFAFRKLTLSYNYCGAYVELDEELGWKLKENASSCVSLKNFGFRNISYGIPKKNGLGCPTVGKHISNMTLSRPKCT